MSSMERCALELINPYAVVRNTATYEAYKAYGRRAAKVGWPFLLVGGLATLLAPQIMLFAGRWLLHRSPLDWRWALASVAVAEGLGAVCIAIWVFKVLRFRKENPIPDEWRQVPRSNPLRAARRTTQPRA